MILTILGVIVKRIWALSVYRWMPLSIKYLWRMLSALVAFATTFVNHRNHYSGFLPFYVYFCERIFLSLWQNNLIRDLWFLMI